MRGGMEAAALRPAAVVDWPAAQNFSEPLKRDVVARVDETISQRRTGDMASVECRYRQSGQRICDERSQASLADILVEHPQEMADLGPAAVFEILLGQFFIDRPCELFIADESGVCIEQIERARVADCHEGQLLALGERKDADVERVEACRIDGTQLARARARRRLQLQQVKAEPMRNAVG